MKKVFSMLTELQELIDLMRKDRFALKDIDYENVDEYCNALIEQVDKIKVEIVFSVSALADDIEKFINGFNDKG